MKTIDKIAKCREQDTGKAYLSEFNRRTEGLEFLSSGICASCGDCQSNYGLSKKRLQAGIDTGTIFDEGSISRNGCDCCGSYLQQKLYDGHAFIKLDGKSILTHLDLCEDCVSYIANGDLPERWEA